MEILSYRISELQEQGDEELILSADELEQAQKRGRNYPLIRCQLKREIARRRQMQPEQIILSYNSHGKPAWLPPQGKQALHFNLSHSADLLFIALAEQPLGIDIEYMRERPFKRIAKRIMAAEQYQYFIEQGCPSHDFYSYWCAMEAIIKLRGISIWNNNTPALDYDAKGIRAAGASAAKLEIWEAATGYMAALAQQPPCPR